LSQVARRIDVFAVRLQRASKVDGVVAAQGVLGDEAAGGAGQWFVERDVCSWAWSSSSVATALTRA
jgi:hypothetical protein